MFMKLGMYIMAPEPISAAYFINPSHQFICLYVCPPIAARQRIEKKRYRGNEYTRGNRRIVGRVVFYAIRVVSKESRRFVLPRTSCIPQRSIFMLSSHVSLGLPTSFSPSGFPTKTLYPFLFSPMRAIAFSLGNQYTLI
jgi:hypothetical protein